MVEQADSNAMVCAVGEKSIREVSTKKPSEIEMPFRTSVVISYC